MGIAECRVRERERERERVHYRVKLYYVVIIIMGEGDVWLSEECPTHSPGLHVGQGPQGHSTGLPHSHQQRMERLCSRTGDEYPDRLRGNVAGMHLHGFSDFSHISTAVSEDCASCCSVQACKPASPRRG